MLACGAELKNTFCLAKGGHAFVSHHIGDLENYETCRSFTEGVEHFRRLFEVEPEVVAHDLHPEYLSTKYALELDGVELVGVQHHHAHIAACLADNGEAGPVIGVAFDGLGYGTDGTIWGGELLVADLAGFRRAGHLRAGADARRGRGHQGAVADGRRLAGRRLRRPGPRRPGRGRAQPGPLGAGGRPGQVGHGLPGDLERRAGCSTPWRRSSASGTRSTTRARPRSSWSSWPTRPRRPPTRPDHRARDDGAPLRLAGSDLVRAVVEDLEAGVPVPLVAARFHNGLAGATVAACQALRDDSGLGTVALSGGVFQNMLLLERTVAGLEQTGFRVLVHSRVPPNDGGISLGQAAVAAARGRGRARRTARPTGHGEPPAPPGMGPRSGG